MLSERDRDQATTWVGNALTALDDPEGIPEMTAETPLDQRVGFAMVMLQSALFLLEPDTYGGAAASKRTRRWPWQKRKAPVAEWTIPAPLVLEVLEVLRLTPIYALKDSHPEELMPDFKPWKFEGFEVEHAQQATACHRRMLDVMQLQERR